MATHQTQPGEAESEQPEDTNSIEVEDGDAAAAADTNTELEAIARKLAEAEARLDDQRNAVLRAHADMDNLRKRMERDVENAHKYALERFVQELLPVKDSLEMGLSAASAEATDSEQLREGTALTLKMLSSAIEKFGVSEVDPQGEAFDPERHQAMSTVDSTEVASGTVVTVVQKGYVLNDRLVRPALVMVAK